MPLRLVNGHPACSVDQRKFVRIHVEASRALDPLVDCHGGGGVGVGCIGGAGLGTLCEASTNTEPKRRARNVSSRARVLARPRRTTRSPSSASQCAACRLSAFASSIRPLSGGWSLLAGCHALLIGSEA